MIFSFTSTDVADLLVHKSSIKDGPARETLPGKICFFCMTLDFFFFFFASELKCTIHTQKSAVHAKVVEEDDSAVPLSVVFGAATRSDLSCDSDHGFNVSGNSQETPGSGLTFMPSSKKASCKFAQHNTVNLFINSTLLCLFYVHLLQ